MTTTPIFGLEEVVPNDPLAYATINFAMRWFEVLARQVIINTTLAAPPGSPAEGDLYFVATSPTGAWSGQAGKLAAWINGGWTFKTVYTGMEFWVVNASARQRWSGSAWV